MRNLVGEKLGLFIRQQFFCRFHALRVFFPYQQFFSDYVWSLIEFHVSPWTLVFQAFVFILEVFFWLEFLSINLLLLFDPFFIYILSFVLNVNLVIDFRKMGKKTNLYSKLWSCIN